MVASLTNLASQATTFLREHPMMPAGRDPTFVIFADGMRFKNNVNAHNKEIYSDSLKAAHRREYPLLGCLTVDPLECYFS